MLLTARPPQYLPLSQQSVKMASTVPELLAKKRKRDEQWAAERAAAALEARKKGRATRKEIFKRAEQYVKEYRSQVHMAPYGELQQHSEEPLSTD